MGKLETRIKASDVLIPMIGPIKFNLRGLKEIESRSLSDETRRGFVNTSIALATGQIYGYFALGVSLAYAIAKYSS
jgi:hypothetical protein